MIDTNPFTTDFASGERTIPESVHRLTKYDWLPSYDRLVSLRRDFHQFPEPSWCEFRTTSRLVAEFDRLGVDEYAIGRDALNPSKRLGVPDEDRLTEWFDRAEATIDVTDNKDFPVANVLNCLKDGTTGGIATLEMGEGPTVGLRVDIDALPITEATDNVHEPMAVGFRSQHEGTMHACGHDAHMTFGLGVMEAVQRTNFDGTLKVFFQPAEEIAGGGHAMMATDHLNDIDYFIGSHIGLSHPTGEVVAGYEKPFAIAHFDVTMHGEASHAGLAPNDGRNALQALATGITNSYGIPRHEQGATRVNFGYIQTNNASNIIAEKATAEAEVRGETTEAMEYMREHLERILESAATMFDCEVTTTLTGHAPRADSDPVLSNTIENVATETTAVTSVVPHAAFGASEDVTHLMNTVRKSGGQAAFIGIGTDHPTGHHTQTFDIDEASLPIGIAVITRAILTFTDHSKLETP